MPNVGDIVMLKTGSPIMVVVEVETQGQHNEVYAERWDGEHFQVETFPPEALDVWVRQ